MAICCVNCYRVIHEDIITEGDLTFCSPICHRDYKRDKEVWERIKDKKIEK